MKKAFLIAACLAAILVGVSSGQNGYIPGTSGSRFDSLTLSNSTAFPGRDNTIKVFVRFDDGRDDVAKRAGTGAEGTGIGYSFARRGLPFGLALNYKQLGGSGDMTVSEVQNLIDYAEARGSQVEIMQHGNTNFGGIGASYALWDTFQTYQRLIDELTPAGLESAFGKKVTAFISPGDGGEINGVPGFVASNYGVIKSVLDSLGIEYAQWGLSSEVHGSFSIVPAVTGGTEAIGTLASQNLMNFLKPGMIIDPHNFPENFTTDLNTMAVERDASDIDCSCDDWTLNADTAIDPGANDAYDKTFRWWYSRRMGAGAGFGIALHDSVNSQNAISGGPYTGSFSHDAIAAILKKLEDQGFIDVVTPSEWYEWMLGSYAKGTDLIGNNYALIPHMEIGDSVGIDAPFPTGWASVADESQAYGTALNSLMVAGWVEDPGTEGQITGYYTASTVGPDVPGFGGGGAHVPTGHFRWNMPNLPPGRYLFSFLTNNQGSTIQSVDSWILAKMKYQKYETAWTQTNMSAWQDTFIVWQGSDVTGSAVLNAGLGAGDIQTPRFEFSLPRDMPSFNTDFMVSQTDRQWSGANGRVWLTDPIYSIQITINYFGNEDISHPHLWYLGE